MERELLVNCAAVFQMSTRSLLLVLPVHVILIKLQSAQLSSSAAGAWALPSSIRIRLRSTARHSLSRLLCIGRNRLL
jgi:hypothetical protein